MSLLPDDAELQALLEPERTPLPVPDDVRARLASRLGLMLVPGVDGFADAPAQAAMVGDTAQLPARALSSARMHKMAIWKLLSVYALGIGTGVALTQYGWEPAGQGPSSQLEPTPSLQIAQPVQSAEPAVAASAQMSEPAKPDAPQVGAPIPTEKVTLPIREPVDVGDRSLARERILVDTARSALARGEAEHALAAVDRHAREFARGQLVDAREALRVQALVKAGRLSEAKSVAVSFHRRFPNSLYEPLVRSLMATIPQ